MTDLDQAIATQLANIETRSGKSLAELEAFLKASGLTKHGALRDLLKRELGMGHGDANTLVHVLLKSHGAAQAEGKSQDEVLDAIYTGAKAALRPVHDAVMALIVPLGDFEVAPKKGYLSLRRKKQFAMVGPATNTKVEVGLNAKALTGSERLVTVPAGGMCNYKVRLGAVHEVDAELAGWLREAFEAAG